MTTTHHTPSSSSSDVPASRISWDVSRDEPFSPLPNHPDVRLTPWRRSKEDEDDAVALFNDPIVTRFSRLKPVPYLPEHLSFIWDNVHPECVKTTDAIRPIICNWSTATTTPKPKLGEELGQLLYPCPVIRFRDRLIGTISLFHRPSNADNHEQTEDASPSWSIAYCLSPEYRGRGIIKEAIATVLRDWVKWTGIRQVNADVEVGNHASQAVLRANGFEMARTEMQPWPDEKGGGEREMGVWVWTDRR